MGSVNHRAINRSMRPQSFLSRADWRREGVTRGWTLSSAVRCQHCDAVLEPGAVVQHYVWGTGFACLSCPPPEKYARPAVKFGPLTRCQDEAAPPCANKDQCFFCSGKEG